MAVIRPATLVDGVRRPACRRAGPPSPGWPPARPAPGADPARRLGHGHRRPGADRAGARSAVPAQPRPRRHLVSGTNGKTTTTALTVAALGCDRSAATATAPTPRPGSPGRSPPATCPAWCSRSTRAWLPWAVEVTRPRQRGATNLTRDQLSRHHEVSAIAAAWRAPWPVCRSSSPTPTTRPWSGQPSPRATRSGSRRGNGGPLTRWSALPAAARCRRTAESWACRSCPLRVPSPTGGWTATTVVGAPRAGCPCTWTCPASSTAATPRWPWPPRR